MLIFFFKPNDGLLQLQQHLIGPQIESSNEQLLNAGSALETNTKNFSAATETGGLENG